MCDIILGYSKKCQWQKGLKTLGKKQTKTQRYDPKNLQAFSKKLLSIRTQLDDGKCLFKINIDNLEVAIKGLPGEDREHIEKFWGLNGGMNHGKRIFINPKDQALLNMKMASEAAMVKLFEIDRVYIYEENLKSMIAFLLQKVDMSEIHLTEMEVIKYIIVYFAIMENGPKMPFEQNPMTVDKSYKNDFIFDEYSVIMGAYEEFQKYPDNFIHLKTLIGWIEWLNFNDSNIIKKTFGISLPNVDYWKEAEAQLQQLPQFSGKQIFPTTKQLNDAEGLKTLSQIRTLKEKIFPYGAWNVTAGIIFSGVEDSDWQECLVGLRRLKRNWNRLPEFKAGEIKLKTSAGLRTMDAYVIGGLEFTDPEEISFLCTAGVM